MYCVAFYDSSKNFIQGYQTDNEEITVPNYANFVIFTIGKNAGSF